MPSPRFVVPTLLATCGLALSLHALHAGGKPSIVPVMVTMIGPKPARVRVAAGKVMPCDGNQTIFSGLLKPGASATGETSEDCVCVEQTYDDFPDAEWSQGWLVCRPAICNWVGEAFVCRPDPDPRIRIAIRSSRPK